MITRGQRSLAQMMAFALAKAVAVTLAFLAGHVTLSVATDLYGFAAPAEPAPAPIVAIQHTQLSAR